MIDDNFMTSVKLHASWNSVTGTQ